jgi:hypothetical protein
MRRSFHASIIALALSFCPTPSPAQPAVSPGAVELEQEAGVASVVGDVDDPLVEKSGEEEEKGESLRRWEPVIAPLPSRNPAFGWLLSVPAVAIYRPSFARPGERVWASGLFGFYAENESWGVGLLHRMSFGGDLWRVRGTLFHADVNYEYFGIGGPGDGPSIVLDQETDLFLAEGLRRVAPDLYVGLRAVYSEISTAPRLPGNPPDPGLSPAQLTQDTTLSTLAPRLQYDTRDAEFFPRQGWLVNGTASFGRDAFGSDEEYERYEASGNHYRPVGAQGVLASRVAMAYVSGGAPFFLYPAFGRGADLRGYQTGSYRDRFLIAAQSEYRHRFTPRFGAVAFAGIGSVAPDFLGWEKSLWSFGGGLRWVLAPKNNISLRFDVARGRDETIWYVGVREAF